MKSYALVAALALLSFGCASTTNHGVLTAQVANPGDLFESAHAYEEIGPTEGQACRYFLLAIIPWGDSTTGTAMKKALEVSGGNAVLNASVTTSLYGFFPIYNVFSFSCTTVKGIAIKFE